MTDRAAPLTIAQKEICRANSEMYPELISRLPGMEGTTKRQISDYLRRPQNNMYRRLADDIERFIAQDGLPKQYAGIIDYIRYLRTKQ